MMVNLRPAAKAILREREKARLRKQKSREATVIFEENKTTE